MSPPFIDLTTSSLTTLRATSKTILITGSSSGIGLATASLLSTLNPSHNLVLLDLHPPPVSLLSSHDASHLLFQKCDVTNWQQQRDAFKAGFEKFGRIDCVFVNAGITEYKDQFFSASPLEDLDTAGEVREADKRVLDVDVNAAVDTVRLAVHYLRRNEGNGGKGGSIVLTASLAGYLGTGGQPLYSAAKHALLGLARALKAPCAKHHIAVSLVAPAITATPILTTELANSTSTLHSATNSSSPPSTSPTPNKSAPPPHETLSNALAATGIPINTPHTIALATAYLFDQGPAANGAGLFIQGDKIVNLEKSLAETRTVWMGEEMLGMFRKGRGSLLGGGRGGRARL